MPYNDVGYRRPPGHNENTRKGAAQRKGINNLNNGPEPDAKDMALSSILKGAGGPSSRPTPGGEN